MLTAFVRLFQTPDLRKKMLMTLGLIVLFRLGASLRTPGISEKRTWRSARTWPPRHSTAGVLAIVNLLSGEALLRLSVFALGIMSYITASIILQLLTVVIPRLETLKQEGQAGQAKITQYTRYLTVGLAILQATGYVVAGQARHLVQRLPVRRAPPDPAHLPERLGTLAIAVMVDRPWWRPPRSSCGWAS